MIRYIEGFSCFVTSTTAPIASGWSKIAGWDSHPLENAALARRTPGRDIPEPGKSVVRMFAAQAQSTGAFTQEQTNSHGVALQLPTGQNGHSLERPSQETIRPEALPQVVFCGFRGVREG